MKPITMNIDDIAKLAGVSKATVSRVLNHRPFVREETREKVWQVIRDMGFSPSIIARNLSLKKSQCIGVILPEIETGFYSELLKSMDLEATLRGYFLLVTFSHSARELGWGEKFLHSGMVEGLIVMMPEVSEVMIKNLMKWGRRVVVLNKKFSKPFVPTLNVDDVDASYQLVSHLLQHGYETVGIVTGPKENFDSQERLVGYMKALLDHGKKFDPSLVEEGDFTEISGYEAVERMSGRGKLPRAIFFSNDAMAMGGIRWLEKKGIKIPEEVAVAGFDDVELSKHLRLTTVRIPIKEMGKIAVESVLGIREEREIIVKGELVIRESCGC
ncbi:LacI family DNA-binding transcriptional regulator [Candidatus Calescamantes bacterium]|nr:LacI family DNA-binding transcriptional regulator [Candidatus Calescamantes bacterium]